MSVDLAESIPYTWTSCEERKWYVGKERVSMNRANDMITLGESEVWSWHGHPTLTKKGDSNFLRAEVVEHSLLAEAMLDHC